LSKPDFRSLQHVTYGWKLAKRFLKDEISFVQAENQFKDLFASDFSHFIWKKIEYINDLDPDQLQSQQLSLAQELDTQIQMSIDAEGAMRSTTVAADDEPLSYDDDDNIAEIRFLLFRVRCFIS
jgi:hypothetical protein